MTALTLKIVKAVTTFFFGYCKQTSLWSKRPNRAFLFISHTQNHLQVSIKLPWQEWSPLHLTDPGPVYIPGVQEKAERLISRFKGKPDKPPKVITMLFVLFFFLFFIFPMFLVKFFGVHTLYIIHMYAHHLIPSFDISSFLSGT